MRVIHLLRKPLEKPNVASNVLAHGCGALHIDVCRIAGPQSQDPIVGGNARINARNAEQGYRPSAYADSNEGVYTPNPEGRWPANLILEHPPGCQRVGTRRVPTGVAVNRHKDGKTPKGMWGFAGQQGPDQTFGDGDGMETVAAWDCTPDCPVPDLDDQSGTMNPSWRAASRVGLGYGSTAVGEREGAGHKDSGGAFRFFLQVHEADE